MVVAYEIAQTGQQYLLEGPMARTECIHTTCYFMSAGDLHHDRNIRRCIHSKSMVALFFFGHCFQNYSSIVIFDCTLQNNKKINVNYVTEKTGLNFNILNNGSLI